MKGTVIYIGGFELPDKNAAAHRVIANAKILRDIGYNVVMVGVTKDAEMAKAENDEISSFRCRHELYPLSSLQWIKRIADISFFKKIFSEYNDVKMVICYNYPAIALAKLSLFCKKRGVKVVSDCTEWYGASGKNPVFRAVKRFDTWYRMTVVQKKLDGIIAISDYLEGYYRKYTKVVNIPPLVDCKDEKWKACEKNNPVKTIVYAGSPGNKDKIYQLVDVLKDINERYLLKVIGISKEEFIKNYGADKDKVDALDDRIIFMGRISHKEVVEIVKMADYSCFIREINRVTTAGFPTKFVESISCGTSVITNSSSNVDRFIKNNGYLIDLDNLKDNLIEILNEDEVLKPEDNTLFDYRRYINVFEQFINEII